MHNDNENSDIDSGADRQAGTSRRTVLKAVGATATGLLLGGSACAAAPRKRYAVVGVGSRARMFTRAITDDFRDDNEIVAVCDNNAGRAALAVRTIAATGASQPRAYSAAQFDTMIRETRPEYVIVTTVDATPRRLHRACARPGLRRHHREADDHDSRQGPAHP